MKIMIVEDEPAIAEVQQAYLEKEGFQTCIASDGHEALRLFKETFCDLIILDLMLPGVTGLDVCREIRRSSDIPILMVTALSGEEEVIAGLDAGADDYVIKPFSPRVLVARVKAHLRREGETTALFQQPEPSVQVDRVKREVIKNGTAIRLTRNEWLLFSVLAGHPEKTYSRDELIEKAFGDDYSGFDRAVDSYIKNIRKKLSDASHPEGFIRTVHGFGYRYEP